MMKNVMMFNVIECSTERYDTIDSRYTYYIYIYIYIIYIYRIKYILVLFLKEKK